ncbi:MAG: hypothetical protein ACPGWR_31235, partial [Ardenticatenaceae bacterium]
LRQAQGTAYAKRASSAGHLESVVGNWWVIYAEVYYAQDDIYDIYDKCGGSTDESVIDLYKKQNQKNTQNNMVIF